MTRTNGVDIVVDANVFGHSGNPSSEYFDSAINVLTNLLGSGLRLALDDSGKRAPLLETSHMYHEYVPMMPPGSLAETVLANLARHSRIDFLKRLVGSEKKKCKELVPANAHDQIVLGVAIASSDGHLVSNDLTDFAAPVRTSAKRIFKVDICTSLDCAISE